MAQLHFRTAVAGAAILLVACLPVLESDTGGDGAKSGETSGADPVLSDPLGPEESCSAASFAHLIGEAADAAVAVPYPKRFIAPGMAVTMDHAPARTNIVLDDAGRITGLSCG